MTHPSPLLSDRYDDPVALAVLRATLIADDYVKLPGLLSAPALRYLDDEAACLQAKGDALSKLNFTMPGCETPRKMFTLGWTGLTINAPGLAAVYDAAELRGLLTALAPEARPSDHPHERMVANFQVQQGHTHGWHLDDPPFALILVLRAPAEAEGGLVEFIPQWPTPSERLRNQPLGPAVLAARGAGLVRRRHHAAGDGYLMRADRTLHCVTPIIDGERVVLNLAFEGTDPTVYRGTSDILHTGEVVGKWPAR